MFKVVTGLLLFALVAVPAAAQESGQSCSTIAEDAARLACYDAIFRDGVPEGEAGGLVLKSERLIPARPSGREPATFAISCEAGAPAVSFSFAGQLVSATGDIAPITFQVDQNATLVRTLASSDNNTSLAFATPREASAFLDALNGGTNLKVRMTPIGQRSVTVDFKLSTVRGEIGALRESCR